MAQKLRYCKSEGLFPMKRRGSRGQGYEPTVETVHAVLLLFVAMTGGIHIRASDTVRDLWAVPFAETTGDNSRAHHVSFGRRCLDLMESAVMGKSKAKFLKLFTAINVAHHLPYATIAYHDGTTERFFPPGVTHSNWPAPISLVALCGPEIFWELAAVVRDSRREALRKKVQIPTAAVLALLDGHPEAPRKHAA